VNIDQLPGMAEYFAKAAIEGFKGNHKGSRQSLYWLIARYLKSGRIYDHPELVEYLATAFSEMAEGAKPAKALEGSTRGPQKSISDIQHKQRLAYTVFHLMLKHPPKGPDRLPESTAFLEVEDELAELNIDGGCSEGSIKAAYYQHRDEIKSMLETNPIAALVMMAHYSYLEV